MLVGFWLKHADLRILHHDIAVRELEANPDRYLSTPIIVDERIDGAHVIYNASVRAAMAHPDVKFWLKRNTYRDFQLNNADLTGAQYHYQILNDIPEFHTEIVAKSPAAPVTPEMASKIRLLPTACSDRFSYFREQKIDWNWKRPIDVSFAGLVDYDGRGIEFWDGKLAEAEEAATTEGNGYLPGLHRRAAVKQLTRLHHLRVLIGMNRAMGPDVYRMSMMRSSISVSPWGLGEYAYRDYESILAGCLLVKPLSDHVQTFAPDIYQSGKYYIPCRPDFSDLTDVIENIMGNRDRAVEVARRAREDMLEATSPNRVYDYYLDLFRQALGDQVFQKAREWRFSSAPVLALEKGRMVAWRCDISRGPAPSCLVSTDATIVLTEDHSTSKTHDVRLFGDQSALTGLYRLRFAMRKRGRNRVRIQLHVDLKDQICLDVDLDMLLVESIEAKGDLFKIVHGPEFARVGDDWSIGTLAVQLTDLVETGLGLILYSCDEAGQLVYDGDGRIALEVAMLDLTRISMPSEHSQAL